MKVRLVGDDEIDTCLAVRLEVFVEGQQVPLDEEVDGLDSRCKHFLAEIGNQAIGTARLRIGTDGQARAERVAVLDSHRGKGVGVALMKALEAQAEADGHCQIHLSAQVRVIPFYEKLGYVAYGPVCLDANIEHRMMCRL